VFSVNTFFGAGNDLGSTLTAVLSDEAGFGIPDADSDANIPLREKTRRPPWEGGLLFSSLSSSGQ
jgi:hypothetical protein